jgi:hypothetical protein
MECANTYVKLIQQETVKCIRNLLGRRWKHKIPRIQFDFKLTLSSTLESPLVSNTITFHDYAHRMQVIIPLKGWSSSDIRKKPKEIKIPFMKKLRAA